jgi:hypothetical protein
MKRSRVRKHLAAPLDTMPESVTCLEVPVAPWRSLPHEVHRPRHTARAQINKAVRGIPPRRTDALRVKHWSTRVNSLVTCEPM